MQNYNSFCLFIFHIALLSLLSGREARRLARIQGVLHILTFPVLAR